MNYWETVAVVIAVLYFLIDYTLILSVYFLTKTSLNHGLQSPISVIIAARNEADNLKINLPYVLNQDHPDFEVIVVDDQSHDETSVIINNLRLYHKHLKCLKIDPNTESSKKNALTQGIKMAQNEHLVFTDADCKILSNKWLTTIQSYFMVSPSVVLGYSPYKKNKTYLNRLIRFETYQTGLNYFGLAKLGLPYMGVGRNLAYTKSAFLKTEGFSPHQHLLSGDDDLLINQLSGKVPIACCLDPMSFVESSPELTFTSWIEQKRRHYTTTTSYKWKHKLILSFQFVMKFLFWFYVLPASIFQLFYSNLLLILILMSCIILKLVLNKFTFKKFMVNDLWLQSLNLEFQLICFQLYIFSLNLISSKKDW